MWKMHNSIDTDVIASNKSNDATSLGPTEIVHLSASIDALHAEGISSYLPDWFT